MSRQKKWIFYPICICILISIYHDIRRSETFIADAPTQDAIPTHDDKMYVIKHTVQQGETLLSIMEETHSQIDVVFHMETIIHDFKQVNNNEDPYDLQLQQTYLFPLYIQ